MTRQPTRTHPAVAASSIAALIVVVAACSGGGAQPAADAELPGGPGFTSEPTEMSVPGSDPSGPIGPDVTAEPTDVSVPGSDATTGDQPGGAGGSITFVHTAIDVDPPSGDSCCLDVITAGDLDGDGDGDIVVGAEHADGWSWYENPGGGAARDGDWTRHVIGSGDFTTDGIVADLDADGDLDLVISAIDRAVVEWWEQVGSDPADPVNWIRHDIGRDYAHDLVLADFDGDGSIDVGAYHRDAERIAWYRQPSQSDVAWDEIVADNRSGEGITAGDLDADGDIDLVAGSGRYMNEGAGIAWARHELGTDWAGESRPRVGDLDGDGDLDVVLVAAETDGALAWYEGPDWFEHVIDPNAGFTHSLEIGDIDDDGYADILAGVMHTAAEPVVRVLLGDGGNTWTEIVLAREGTHNARLFDLDGDGDLDVIGKNYDGPKQVDVWWADPAPVVDTPSAGAANSGDTPLDNFTYVQVDDARERFNGTIAFFGLAFTDVDGDADVDIASGRYVYTNPYGTTGGWTRTDLAGPLGVEVDVMLATDVDGDARADLIATALPDVWWIEAGDEPDEWSGAIVASVPATSRPNGQGYRLGDLDGDGRDEIVLSGGNDESQIWYVTVPDDPSAETWPATRVTDRATDEQVGIGDFDGDGDLDLAAGDMHDGGSYIAWFENPGDGSEDWTRHRLGEFPGVFPDRLDVADVDGDGRLDVIVTEENGGEAPDADVAWYRQPDEPTASDWQRFVVVEQFTTNGLDVADLDGDGDADLVTGEHRGAKRVAIWENVGSNDDGSVEFVEHVVDEGKESHLGARVADLDGDGDFEIVSIGFDDYASLHLWLND